MIAAFRRILLLLAVHVIFFVCYPDTMELGTFYGGLSLALWCFVVFITIKPLSIFSALPGLFIIGDLLIMAGAGFTLAYTLPQKDNSVPLDKLKAHQYPTRTDIRKGLAKFGLKLPPELEKAAAPEIKMPDMKAVRKAEQQLRHSAESITKKDKK